MRERREKLGRAWARLKAAHHCALESLDGSPQQCERAYDLLINALDDYDQRFEECWHLTPPAELAAPTPTPVPTPAPEPAPVEPKQRLLGEIEWGRWKPAETSRCTCYRFWMGVVPPPRCPIHGLITTPIILNGPFRPDNKK